MTDRDERTGQYAVLCGKCGQRMTTYDRLLTALTGKQLCEKCLNLLLPKKMK